MTSALGYTDSGEAKKEEAVQEMREAQAQTASPPSNVRIALSFSLPFFLANRYCQSSLAEKVGKAVGCPGLEEDGQVQTGSSDSTGTSNVGPSGGAVGEKEAASKLGKL